MNEEDFDDVQMKINAYKEYGEDPQSDLTDWERNFMNDQIARVEQYGSRTRFSAKQMDVIDRVYGKLPI